MQYSDLFLVEFTGTLTILAQLRAHNIPSTVFKYIATKLASMDEDPITMSPNGSRSTSKGCHCLAPDLQPVLIITTGSGGDSLVWTSAG